VAYSRGFPQKWPGGGYDAVVRIDLVDAFAILQTFDLVTGFARGVERSDERIAAVLDAIGIPTGLRDLDVGTVTVAPIEVTAEGTSGLDHAKSVAADGEYGPFFVAKDGKLTFHSYLRRLNQASVHTFSDTAGSPLPYGQDFDADWDDTYLWNYVRATGAGQDTAAVTRNAASELDYHTLTKTVSSPIAGGSELQQLADRLASIYAQPLLRSASLPLQGASVPASLWPVILDLEVSDRITVQRQPKAGAPIVLQQYVEGVRHQCRAGGPWTTTVPLSPADERTYMVANHATLGLCDSGNLAA
jgi:hypothetical protein